MFTVQQRDAFRERVLGFAEADERVVAGAAVGSLAVDAGDPFSDVDLTFGIADGVPVASVLRDWTCRLVDDFDGVPLVDLERGPTTYRVFLLPEMLQFDLSMTPAAAFRPAGPRFRLLFGETAAGGSDASTPAGTGSLFISTPAVASDIFGWGVIYALHARACIERGRVGKPSTTSAPSEITRSRSPASAKTSLPCRPAASTTFPLRSWLDSRMPTSASSNLERSVRR